METQEKTMTGEESITPHGKQKFYEFVKDLLECLKPENPRPEW